MFKESKYPTPPDETSILHFHFLTNQEEVCAKCRRNVKVIKEHWLWFFLWLEQLVLWKTFSAIQTLWRANTL